MSEMVERLARTIATALGDDFVDAFESKAEWIAARVEKGGRYRDVNEPLQEDYLHAARQALTDMREPTEAMERAGELKLAWAKYEAVDIWRAMNDEALK